MREVPGLRTPSGGWALRRDRWRGRARARRVGGRVPARGPAPPPPAEQGPRRGPARLPALTGDGCAPVTVLRPTGATSGRRRAARPGGGRSPGRPLLALGRHAGRPRPRRRRDPRCARRRPDGRGDLAGAPPADGARLAVRRPVAPRTWPGSRTCSTGSRGARGAAGALPAGRRPRRRPRGARRDRRRRSGRRRAAPRPRVAAAVGGSGGGRPTRRSAAPDAPRPGGQAARQLDALPPDVGGRIRALQDYDFLEPDARASGSTRCSSGSRKQVLDQYIGPVRGAPGR